MISNIRIYILLFIINIYLTKTDNLNVYNNNLRNLKSKIFLNSTSKNIKSLKFHFKLLQTLYSDSFSKNYYYTTLYVGDKKVKQTYIIDTGSEIMSSPCSPCEECGTQKNSYFYDYSRHHKPLKCSSEICKLVPATDCEHKKDRKLNGNSCSFHIIRESGDGIKGYYLKDIVYFETDTNEKSEKKHKTYRSYAIPIGCTRAEYGEYKMLNTDGIMGLNRSPKSFINVLNKLKIINHNIFSLCFGITGGYMSLGEIDKTYHKSVDIPYVPLLESDISYLIHIKGFSVGKKEKSINTNYVASIDTGNSISYFPRHIYKSIIKEFDELCLKKNGSCGSFEFDHELGYCASFSNRETLFRAIYEYWPNINLYLDQDIEYTWKPINYYYYYFKDNQRKACLGFNGHKYKNIILGTNFVHGYDIIFNSKEKRIGFVSADCSRGNLIWNRKKGSNDNIDFETDPHLIDKFIHKNETENKFIFGDNSNYTNNITMIEFIQGHNTELNMQEFKTINFIIFLTSIIMVIIVISIILFVLICNKKGYLKYENKEETNNYYEEPNGVINTDNNLKIEGNDENKNEENK